jgi:hypothetical protein
MAPDTQPIYPNCPVVTREVTIGGLTRAELYTRLLENGIRLNESAETLFASELFTTEAAACTLTTVELTAADLGFPNGATTAEIFARAEEDGLSLCPMELAAHLRLQFLDQPEGFWGQPLTEHQAPSGSITVLSVILSPEDEFPKGFYLRRIKGELWLRGYRAGPEHVWEAGDHLLFRRE